MDGPALITCIKTCIKTRLAPTLDEGDVVVPDNLPAHRVATALAAIRERGAWLLFLPPCSPDLKPTGPAFLKPKARMKRLALGTVGDLWNGAGAILELFSRQECANLFSATGYGANQNGNALGVQSRREMACFCLNLRRMHYGTDTSRQRSDHARRPSSNTAIESFGRGTRGAVSPEPENDSQMAHRRFPNSGRHGC